MLTFAQNKKNYIHVFAVSSFRFSVDCFDCRVVTSWCAWWRCSFSSSNSSLSTGYQRYSTSGEKREREREREEWREKSREIIIIICKPANGQPSKNSCSNEHWKTNYLILGSRLYRQSAPHPLVGSAMECADSEICKTTCGFPVYTTSRSSLVKHGIANAVVRFEHKHIKSITIL